MQRKIFGRLKKFFVEVEVELKKVSWTKMAELKVSTSVVVVAVLVIAVFVGSVDRILSAIINLILRYGA